MGEAGSAGLAGEAGSRADPGASGEDDPRDVWDPADAVDSADPGAPVSVASEDWLGSAMLAGHWWVVIGEGRCPHLHSWYSFAPNGTGMTHTVVDLGGDCHRAEFERKGSYWFQDRDLVLQLPAAEIGGASLLPEFTSDGQTEFLGAAIVRGADPDQPEVTHLDRATLIGRDARHFRGRHRLSVSGLPGGIDRRIEINISLSRNLRGVQAGSLVMVHVLARVIHVAGPGPGSVQHEVELDYPAVVERDRGWLRLVASRFLGLDPYAAHRAWQDMLDEAGAHMQPAWVHAEYERRVYPGQRFAPEDPTVLVSAQVARTGLTQATEGPPPITDR